MGVVRALVTRSSSDHGARPLGCGQRGDQEGGTASRPAPAAAPGRSPAPSVAHSRHAPHRGLVSGSPPSPTLPVLTTLKGRGGGPEPGRHSSAGEGTWGVTAKPRACGLRVLPWSPPLWPSLGATSGLSSPLARRGHAGDGALGPAGWRGGGSCLRPRPHQHGQDACRRGWWPTSGGLAVTDVLVATSTRGCHSDPVTHSGGVNAPAGPRAERWTKGPGGSCFQELLKRWHHRRPFGHLRSGWLDREGSGAEAQDTAGGHRSCAPGHIVGADPQNHRVPKKTGRLGPR